MKSNSMTVLFLSLLLMLFISACGNERIVYVVVTATPETNTANAAAERNTEEELPAVLQVDESSEAEAPAATAEPVAQPTSVPVNTQAEEVAEAQPSDSANEPSNEPAVEGALPPTLSGKAERIAFMGPFGQSSTLQAYVVKIDGTGLTALSEELGEGLVEEFNTQFPDEGKFFDGKRAALAEGYEAYAFAIKSMQDKLAWERLKVYHEEVGERFFREQLSRDLLTKIKDREELPRPQA